MFGSLFRPRQGRKQTPMLTYTRSSMHTADQQAFTPMGKMHLCILQNYLEQRREKWKNDLLVGQCSAEMLLDVRLQHRVEVLEFPVSDQADDVDLADRGGYEASQ